MGIKCCLREFHKEDLNVAIVNLSFCHNPGRDTQIIKVVVCLQN